jgi:hypothetical protein
MKLKNLRQNTIFPVRTRNFYIVTSKRIVRNLREISPATAADFSGYFSKSERLEKAEDGSVYQERLILEWRYMHEKE